MARQTPTAAVRSRLRNVIHDLDYDEENVAPAIHTTTAHFTARIGAATKDDVARSNGQASKLQFCAKQHITSAQQLTRYTQGRGVQFEPPLLVAEHRAKN